MRVPLLLCDAFLCFLSQSSDRMFIVFCPNGAETSSSSESSSQKLECFLHRNSIDSDTGLSTEGTHELTMDDGRIVALESQLLTLNDYVGKQIWQRRRTPVIDGTGMIILRVDSVTVLTQSSDSSSSVSVPRAAEFRCLQYEFSGCRFRPLP